MKASLKILRDIALSAGPLQDVLLRIRREMKRGLFADPATLQQHSKAASGTTQDMSAEDSLGQEHSAVTAGTASSHRVLRKPYVELWRETQREKEHLAADLKALTMIVRSSIPKQMHETR